MPPLRLFPEVVDTNGSSRFSVGTFSLARDGPGSHPQMTQIITDVFRGSTPLLGLRNLRRVTQSCQSFA
jgi:hypothetical protein